LIRLVSRRQLEFAADVRDPPNASREIAVASWEIAVGPRRHRHRRQQRREQEQNRGQHELTLPLTCRGCLAGTALRGSTDAHSEAPFHSCNNVFAVPIVDGMSAADSHRFALKFTGAACALVQRQPE